MKPTTNALAAGVLIGVVAVAGNATVTARTAPAEPTTTAAPAAPTTTTAADASVFPPPAGEVPPDWTWIVDDTQTIQIAVPPHWNDVSTAPDPMDSPTINASPDSQAELAHTGPGVSYSAWEYWEFGTDDHSLVYYNENCTDEGEQSFDNGHFVGHIRTYTACGGTSATVYRVFANPPDQTFTASVIIQLVGEPGDAQVLNGLLLSFGQVNPGPPVPTEPVPAAAGTFPPPTGEVPADWVTVTDDTGTLQIRVPAAWTDVNTAGGGAESPGIVATTDAALFVPDGEPTFSVPGVVFGALPYSPETEGLLAGIGVYAEMCTDGGFQAYEHLSWVGHVRVYTACGGTATTIYQLAVNQAGGTAHTAVLMVQLTGEADDAATLNGLLLSMSLNL